LKLRGMSKHQCAGLPATSIHAPEPLRQVDLSHSVPSVAQLARLLGGGRPEGRFPRYPDAVPLARGPITARHDETGASGARDENDKTRSWPLRPTQPDPIRGSTQGPKGRRPRWDLRIGVLAQQERVG